MSACSAGPNCKRLMASLRLAQGYEGPEQFILSRNLPIELPDHDVIEKGRPQVAAGLIAPIIPEHPLDSCSVSHISTHPQCPRYGTVCIYTSIL